MEDAATAEIARIQLWQWVFHEGRLDTGHPIASSYVEKILRNAAGNVKSLVSGISDKHIQIATDYMAQIKAECASELLTSDLLPYLEQLDGGKWVKSSL